MAHLLAAIGGALGALARWGLSEAVPSPGGRPWATLLVNVAGSGLLGVVLGLGGVPAWVVALVGTGFCGTLTTFSTFGADVLRLLEERALGRALAYVTATFVLGLGAAATGYLLSR